MKCRIRVGKDLVGKLKNTTLYLFALATILSILLWCNDTWAGQPQLNIKIREGQTSGRMIDGRLLATVTVVYSEAHNGFRVWSEAPVNGAPHRNTLAGRKNSGNKLNIRLSGKGWQPDTEKGRGIIIRTDNVSAIFDVEVDGAQNLPVDDWMLQIKAVALLP